MKRRLMLMMCACFFIISAYAGELKTEYDVIVANDGSGDFTTVQEAVFSLRGMMAERKTIFIKNGVYHEKVVIPTWTLNVSLIGESRDSTIITWSDHANMSIAGTDKKMGTFRTYTLLVQGHGIKLENLTIQNNAPELGQAVALHVEGDKAEFINCNILGFQDTIFAGSETSRQFYYKCYIDGTTDFIFGPSTAYFLECEIHCKKNSYITAPSTPKNKEFGLIFNKCIVTADSSISKVYLGRPWRPYGNTVFINCELGSFIRAEGWHNWRNSENEKTARFIECNNTGDGAWQVGRVAWANNLDKSKLQDYTIEKVLGACDNWNPLAN